MQGITGYAVPDFQETPGSSILLGLDVSMTQFLPQLIG
jgi:hypothetical protein